MNALTKIFITLIAAITGSAGCTSIEIKQSDGSVQIERRFGFASIQVADDSKVVTAKVTSVGFFSSSAGHVIGYGNFSITNSDGSCRIIVWVDDSIDIQTLKKKLKPIDSVCLSQ